MIDRLFCINLKHRQDRKDLAKEQFNRHKLTVEFIKAVDGRQGKFATEECDNYNNACTLSHLLTIEKAKAEGLKTILIFEDDVILHQYFNQNLLECFADLPLGWDMLYLGGSHRKKPEKVTDRIYKVVQTLTTHAYIIRESMFDAVIENFVALDRPVDCFYAELQKMFKCYVTNPPLAWQRTGYSDLCHREMAYPWLETNEQIRE